MFSKIDFKYMKYALTLAKKCLYNSNPNPRVGCVLVKNNIIIGEGFTQPAGFDHAEICALNDAKIRGNKTENSTVYITFEPCSYFGKTPPCVYSLIQAKVSNVISSMKDPNPKVSGKGFAILKEAGIDVKYGLMEDQAKEINIGFIFRMLNNKPWVRMKIAASLDGKTALKTGESKWITCDVARTDNHVWRARSSAILTGVGTIIADNPYMTARISSTLSYYPKRILIDKNLDAPVNSRIFSGHKSLIFCAFINKDNIEQAKKLRSKGIEIIATSNDKGSIDFKSVLNELSIREINELHVEAGHRLNGSLLNSNCINELLIYFSPSILGKYSFDMFDFICTSTLKNRIKLNIYSFDKIGTDLRVIARFSKF